LSVRDLVREVARAGVTVFALTDHDTVDGLDEARDEANRLGLVHVNGVEISTRVEAVELHILGYGFDPHDPALGALLASAAEQRRARVSRMTSTLQRLGLAISVEEVEALAAGHPPGRPHLAQALVARGYARDLDQAFRRFLRKGAVAWVPHAAPQAGEAIESIHAAGGKAVWAHPLAGSIQSPGGFDRLVRELKTSGLDGLEVVHPAQHAGSRRRIRTAARELCLALTGGSDFHGALTPKIAIGSGCGRDEVPSSWVDALLATSGVGPLGDEVGLRKH
jgi:predicted metal-dependent phosphoesterase TrpH